MLLLSQNVGHRGNRVPSLRFPRPATGRKTAASMAHASVKFFAPRALIFRPLVKGNKDFGNKTDTETEYLSFLPISLDSTHSKMESSR